MKQRKPDLSQSCKAEPILPYQCNFNDPCDRHGCVEEECWC